MVQMEGDGLSIRESLAQYERWGAVSLGPGEELLAGTV